MGKDTLNSGSRTTNPQTRRIRIVLITICVAIFILLATIVGRFVFIRIGAIADDDLRYTQEYMAGEGNIKGDVNIEYFREKSEDFAIGANQYGYAVFKNPSRAFRRLRQDYAEAIKMIQKEFDLPALSNFTIDVYKTYGWQVTTENEEEWRQTHFVSEFLDIYENSFR